MSVPVVRCVCRLPAAFVRGCDDAFCVFELLRVDFDGSLRRWFLSTVNGFYDNSYDVGYDAGAEGRRALLDDMAVFLHAYSDLFGESAAGCGGFPFVSASLNGRLENAVWRLGEREALLRVDAHLQGGAGAGSLCLCAE